MKIGLIYFSATGNTARVAGVITETIEQAGMKVAEYDVTALAQRRKKIDVGSHDAFMFGFPVHSLRAPRVMRDWLRTMDGQGKKCSMFFTYGGFLVHPAHHTTRRILTEQNFTVVSSAEIPGAHTFNHGGWRAFADRPDDGDFNLVREYSLATLERFADRDPDLLGDLDQGRFSEKELDDFESLRFRIITRLPSRNGDECCLCRACEEFCPTGAMDADAGRAAADSCIACLRCVAVCPQRVLTVNDTRETWKFKLEMGKTTEEKLNMQQGKIYL